MNSHFKDFEDSVQYFTATENNINGIITRNLKDFKSSQIPVMTAEEFLKSYNKWHKESIAIITYENNEQICASRKLSHTRQANKKKTFNMVWGL